MAVLKWGLGDWGAAELFVYHSPGCRGHAALGLSCQGPPGSLRRILSLPSHREMGSVTKVKTVT